MKKHLAASLVSEDKSASLVSSSNDTMSSRSGMNLYKKNENKMKTEHSWFWTALDLSVIMDIAPTYLN